MNLFVRLEKVEFVSSQGLLNQINAHLCVKRLIISGTQNERGSISRISWLMSPSKFALIFFQLFVHFYLYASSLLQRYQHSTIRYPHPGQSPLVIYTPQLTISTRTTTSKNFSPPSPANNSRTDTSQLGEMTLPLPHEMVSIFLLPKINFIFKSDKAYFI